MINNISQSHANQDYKIIEKYIKPKFYNSPDKTIKKLGIFLDLETTGFDCYREKIIEIAMVKFEYNEDGLIYQILEEFQSFQDPNIPIPLAITELTGITDEMVKDHIINEEKVALFLENVDLIIAYNSKFDRNFFEISFPNILHNNKAWGCLYKDVDWRGEKMPCLKLECIALRYNFFYDSHRAISDCLAGIHVASKILPLSHELVLKKVVECSKKPFFNLIISNSYEHREFLKVSGYHFDNSKKAWVSEVIIDRLENEIKMLKSNIFQNKNQRPIIDLQILDCYNRFLNQYRLTPNQHQYLDVLNHYNSLIDN